MHKPPPVGLAPHILHSLLTALREPIFARQTDHASNMILTLAHPHINSRGLADRGLIAVLSDNAMG